MKQEIVSQLIDLNNAFYKKVATPFTQTRSYSWTGWDEIASVFTELGFSPKRILDLGCGNGRFLTFIKKQWSINNYLGIDSSNELLSFAKESYREDASAQFITHDIFKNPELSEISDNYDLIVLLGVMHHVPSEDLRVDLLKNAAEKLEKGGYLVATFWDFLSEKKLSKKVVDWNLVNISEVELDKRDYLLDWKRDKTAYRYCHYYTFEEIEKLLVKCNLKSVKQFFADGPGGRANRYVLMQRA